MFNLFKPFDILTIKSSGIVAYNPLINYDWSTTTTSGLRYLKDVGSTPTYNASMYFGRGAYLNGVDQGVTFDKVSPLSENTILFNISNIGVAYDYPLMASDSYDKYRIIYSYVSGDYWQLSLDLRQFGGSIVTTGHILPKNTNCQICIKEIAGVISIYANNEVVKIFNATLNGGSFNQLAFSSLRRQYSKSTIKDLFIFNRTLTRSEITQAYEQPELFYTMAQADNTCVLNMPMCETSSTVRNYKNGTDYPIINYTTSVRDNAKNLQYGLQTCKFVRNSLGVIQSASDYLECNGTGYADTGWIPSANEKWTIETILPKAKINDIEGIGVENTYGVWIRRNRSGLVSTRIGLSYVTYIGNINDYCLITCTYTNGSMLTYVNGITAGITQVGDISGQTVGFTLGKVNTQTTKNLNNPIRLFKVHNKVLTQAEITANYNSYVAKGLLS